MADRPLVSVLMPAHRDSEMLRAAARSVLAQGVDDLELVITDDSGGDLRQPAAALGDPRVRYVANPARLGLAGNHTAALHEARGEIVAFLHDDDEWLPGYLPTSLEVLQRDPQVGVVCGDVWIDRAKPAWDRRDRPAAGRYEHWLALVCRYGTFIPSSTVMRRAVWEQRTREMPDLPVGDIVMFIEAALTDWALVWIDEPLVRYRMHPGNAGGSDRQFAFRSAIVEIFDSYRFDAPADEAARRDRLAGALISRAGQHLREGRPAEARVDLQRAAEVDPSRQRARRLALLQMLDHPGAMEAARRVRDLFPRI